MRIRKGKLWAAVLSAALLFNMTAVPAMADPMEEEVSQNDGDAVSIDDWTVDPDDSHRARIFKDENGDGDIIYCASIKDGTNWGTVTVSGNNPAGNIILYKTDDRGIGDSDRVTLDVDCDNRGLDDPVYVFFHLDLLTDDNPDDWNDNAWKQFLDGLGGKITVTGHENTTFFRDWTREERDDGGFQYYVCYEFASRDYWKTAVVGGWTVTDKNVTGTDSSYAYGRDYSSDENWCFADVISPSQNRIDTLVSGSTYSKHIDLGFWYNEDEMRILTTGDKVLLDVKNPDDGNRDEVSVVIPKSNFQDNATEADIRKIVEIKENPGVVCEVDEFTREEDNGTEVGYWEFYFDGTTAQDKREALVTEERSKDTSEKTERTQVLGDDVKVTGEKKGKKWNFSVTGLKEMKGIRKLTLNAGTKFKAEDLKGLDMSKVTVSFNEADGKTTDGTAKDVKKLLKIDKRGQVTVKADKGHASYTLMIPVENCTLCLKVVSVDFDKKAVKDNKITALQGEGSTVSVNLVQFIGKNASEDESEFLSADWTVDGKTEVKTTDPTKPVKSKKGINVYLSKDYRTITLANPGDVKSGNVKIIAMINGKKYSAVVKVKVKP